MKSAVGSIFIMSAIALTLSACNLEGDPYICDGESGDPREVFLASDDEQVPLFFSAKLIDRANGGQPVAGELKGKFTYRIDGYAINVIYGIREGATDVTFTDGKTVIGKSPALEPTYRYRYSNESCKQGDPWRPYEGTSEPCDSGLLYTCTWANYAKLTLESGETIHAIGVKGTQAGDGVHYEFTFDLAAPSTL